MSSKKKEKRKRKYSSSSSGSDSSSTSSSSSGSSSSSSDTDAQDKKNSLRKSSSPPASLDCVSAMLLDTKPDELIDQIFIILDDAEIKELCPTILKHMSISDLKEKALSCIAGLDEASLQALYTEQEVDPGAEEIDKALLQLGLVGNSNALLERDTNKWKTIQEEDTEDIPDEEEKEALNGEGAIFTEENKEPELPKRKLLADTTSESVDDAEAWRALLMKDKESMSMKLDRTDVIASNLSDKPIDFVPKETTIRRRHDEESSGGSRPLSSSESDRGETPPIIGNPPLAMGNPPLVEEPEKPKLSYRQRAAAAVAAEEEEEEDKISAADISSGSSDSDSSSSEEGEISDDDDDEVKERKSENSVKKEVKEEPPSPPKSQQLDLTSHQEDVTSSPIVTAVNSPRHSATNSPRHSAYNSPNRAAPDLLEDKASKGNEQSKATVKSEIDEDDEVSDLYAL